MPETPDPAKCPRCGADLTGAGAIPGGCPRCLLRIAMSDPDTPPAQPNDLPLPSPDAVDRALPDYTVGELIGRGGTGAVYLAVHLKLERQVAIKVLLPDPDGDPEFAARFEQEARTMAKLCHPGIVAIRDFGRAPGFCYLVMEYVEGQTLRQRMREVLSSESVVDLARQICSALEYAHAAGVVHRDIKPENVLIDVAGRVHITDFGLARVAGSEASGLRLTRSDQALGTLHYMAPEVVHRGEADHRADLYAVGVMLYEMLTGTLPIGRFPSPSEMGADRTFDAVVLRALDSDPAQRYQHAGELADDLRAAEDKDSASIELRSRSARAARIRGARRRRRAATAPPPDHADEPETPAGAAMPPGETPCDDPQPLPVLSYTAVLVLAAASAMDWGTITSSPTIPAGMPIPGMFGDMTLDLNAWNGHLTIQGIRMPLWTALLLGIATAGLHTARRFGFSVSRIATVGTSLAGLLFCLASVLIFGTADRSTLGLGGVLSLACFAVLLVGEQRSRAHR